MFWRKFGEKLFIETSLLRIDVFPGKFSKFGQLPPELGLFPRGKFLGFASKTCDDSFYVCFDLVINFLLFRKPDSTPRTTLKKLDNVIKAKLDERIHLIHFSG